MMDKKTTRINDGFNPRYNGYQPERPIDKRPKSKTTVPPPTPPNSGSNAVKPQK